MLILKCYTKAFSQERDHILWQNLRNYLEDFGIDVDQINR